MWKKLFFLNFVCLFIHTFFKTKQKRWNTFENLKLNKKQKIFKKKKTNKTKQNRKTWTITRTNNKNIILHKVTLFFATKLNKLISGQMLEIECAHDC